MIKFETVLADEDEDGDFTGGGSIDEDKDYIVISDFPWGLKPKSVGRHQYTDSYALKTKQSIALKKQIELPKRLQNNLAS
ncbi:hypothetical protein CFP56_028079 [Quercus suber]|uniref:Uncharacterized protein n=1 Tax=Quercus suber TaxID=58331 RepID=A0AAW0JU52_QUESU